MKKNEEDLKEETGVDPALTEKETKSDKKLLREVERLSQELEKATAECERWKNKYYEAYADLDNTRKNLNRDYDVALKYRGMGFIEKLLPALDSFEMAFKIIPADEKIKNYTKGFEMIYSQFEKALKEEGVTPIAPQIGDPFDHNNMQAIAVEDGEQDNLIKSVYLKGYYLKDRIIRPAMVVVTKVPAAISPESESERKE